eukprot:NODE_3477_length_1212_cov_126.750230_g3299_i0.p1 GENE.NODE_3477_length_1212_cov_126.750230_g3299_i0~~NODE_3477_length_1212_cov_126.750230_g3299_i0.p1  ORF type:complete len:296 (-),score=71.35 NODE_3477_length_1212_cov_126.750230_g3299_i0:323-1156(-)
MESVYNLIPRAVEEVSRPPMYRSKHNANMPPSCSTMGLQGTTKLTRNESGGEEPGHQEQPIGGYHVSKKDMGCIGREVIGHVNPSTFLKRTTPFSPEAPGASLNKSSSVKRFDRPLMAPKRPTVPDRTERPVMGLTTEKNFIVANAVDNILAVPKKPAPGPPTHTTTRSFGKVPKYLTKIKREIDDEYAYINTLNDQQVRGETDRMRVLTESEKSDIISGLKKKWEDTHKQYQSLTFNIDTVTKISRKENLEVEMEQIEKAIQKLTKKNIYIYDDTM